MSILQYNFPTTIRFGAGAVQELGPYLKKHQLVAPLIVTDPTVAQLPFFKQLISRLSAQSIAVEVFFRNP